jgi:hypothetical protein
VNVAGRVGAIIKADLLIRFRRASTLVVFLTLSAFAYLWVPDPSTGRALLIINGQRALYNSAAIGMATASIATIFIGLAGFYVISNALRRDLQTRCGYVIASTTMKGGEYLFGKFAGNVAFLTLFITGFMVTSMAMLIVRGEARLEPLVFITQYLMLVPPAIAFVSAVAITFESIPWLAGRLGDVVYFFLYMFSLGAVASTTEAAGGPGVLAYFDYAGFGYLMPALKETLGTTSVAIGASAFDPRKGTFVFSGLTLDPRWIGPRLVATLTPLALLAVARLFFHRFDPARVRKVAEKVRRGRFARISGLLKPLVRPIYSAGALAGRGVVLSDALLTVTLLPVSAVAMVAFAVAALAAPGDRPMSGVMPIAFAVLAVLIADIASRDKRAGATALVYASPHLKASFVLWKFASTLVFSAAIVLVPLIRVAMDRPASVLALVIGVVFCGAIATFLGTVSSNPKTFIVVFLSFWYLVVNDRGKTAALDFAGFYGSATAGITAAYGVAAVVALTAAHLFHAAQSRRSW